MVVGKTRLPGFKLLKVIYLYNLDQLSFVLSGAPAKSSIDRYEEHSFGLPHVQMKQHRSCVRLMYLQQARRNACIASLGDNHPYGN
jgi:hypothetical protein